MMTSTDPISDMLARFRNAIAVGKREVSMPHSNTKLAIAKVLVARGFLVSVKASQTGKHKALTVVLSHADTNSPISFLARLSKPGRRLYVQADKIPTVKRGRGIVILSTSAGFMSGDEARAKKLGGELICEVY